MSPNTEQEILRKLDNISFLLLGVDGQENTGFINRTEDALAGHGKRIDTLEKWMWRCIGGAIVLVALFELIRRAKP